MTPQSLAAALRLDQLILDGVGDQQPFHWLLAYGASNPFGVIAPRVPSWCRLQLLETLDQWINRTARLCIHRPRVERFDLAVAASVRPGVVACPICEAFMLHGERSRENWELCGLCGSASTDVASITFGVLTWRTPTCDACKPAP
jgi:hypothetical protein